MKEERRARGFRSGSLCGPATGGWMPAEQRWWKELRRLCSDVTYCPSGSAELFRRVSTGIIISAGKFSEWWTKFPVPSYRNQTFRDGRSCLIFRLLIFFSSLLFNVAWKLQKWFRSSIQLALRNKKIRVVCVWLDFSSQILPLFFTGILIILLLHFGRNT